MENRIARERKTGQQILLAKMVLGDAEQERRTGFHCITKKNIIEWTGIPEDAINELWEDISLLRDKNICIDAAEIYTGDLSANVYGTLLEIYSKFRTEEYYQLACTIRQGAPKDSYYYNLKDMAEENAKVVRAKEYIHVEDYYLSAEYFEKAISFLLDFYIERVTSIYSKEYDWDFIKVVLGEDEQFTTLMKIFVDEAINNMRFKAWK